jgi:hypothetical protein
MDGVYQRTSDHHLLATLAESETFGLGSFRGEVVGVGRWRIGGLLGEVVLVAVAEAGGTGRNGVLEFVELIAATWRGEYLRGLRLRNRLCLGKE